MKLDRDDIVLVAGVRTAFGAFGGALKGRFRGHDAQVVGGEILQRAAEGSERSADTGHEHDVVAVELHGMLLDTEVGRVCRWAVSPKGRLQAGNRQPTPIGMALPGWHPTFTARRVSSP